MVDTIIRFLLLLLGAVASFGIYNLSLKKDNWNTGLTFIASLAIILASLFTTLQEFTAKFGGGEFSVKNNQHEAPESQRKKYIEMAQDADKKVEITEDKKKLLEEAVNRSDKERSPEDYLALATDAWRNKKYDESLKYAYAGLNLNPKDIQIKATLLHMLGSNFQGLGNNEFAIQYYKEAINTDPKLNFPHNNLGNLYSDQQKYDEAEKAYNEAIRLKPDDASAHYNLGNLYSNQKKYGEAEKAYKEATRLQSDYVKAHYNLGNLYSNQKKYGEAEKAYKEAIRLQSDYVKAHYNLGILYSDQQKYDEAEKAYKEAIRLKHDDADAHYNLGILYSKQKKYDEAEKELKEAIRLKPDDAEAQKRLEMVLQKKKELGK